MKEDVQNLTEACIYFTVSRNGEKMPRSLSTALHVDRLNEVIFAEFLYLRSVEESELKYRQEIGDETSFIPDYILASARTVMQQ